MSNLLEKKCTACELGAPLVPDKDQIELLKDLEGWQLDKSDISKLVKIFKFSNYLKTLNFVNLIADLAESEDHHPDLTVKYGSCKVVYTTHAIGGLSENDFICAKKIDNILT